MGPVELVGVVRLTRDWAEDVRLQAVLMTVAEWPGWLHLTVRLHQYTLGSSHRTIAMSEGRPRPTHQTTFKLTNTSGWELYYWVFK